MKSQQLTAQQLEILNSHPFVKEATNKRISLTYECRLAFWNQYQDNLTPANLRKFLSSHGVAIKLISTKKINNLVNMMRINGCPTSGKNSVPTRSTNTFGTNSEGRALLLNTGKFIEKGQGISFSEDFIEELFSRWPQSSVEDSLTEFGIDPKLVGYQRIRNLTLLFQEGENAFQKSTARKSAGNRIMYSDDVIEKLKAVPAVSNVTPHQLRLSEAFYSLAAMVKNLHINHILKIFKIDPVLLSISAKNNIAFKIRNTLPSFIMPEANEYWMSVHTELIHHLEKQCSDLAASLKKSIQNCEKLVRKQICQILKEYFCLENSGTVRQTLSLLGISKSSYYSILENEEYGKSLHVKKAEDLETIRTICLSSGFGMGSRQVQMQLNAKYPSQKMGIRKVRRLMREAGFACYIRRPKKSNKTSKQLIKRNLKPNVLFRMFSLGKPLTHLLTDVTYLDYGADLRAYKSCIKDAVTGRILASVISEGNDAQLIMDMLEQISNIQFPDGAIFHSDQGVLYFLDEIQEKIKSLGLVQSMSRRGNCWDNSPIESYFGHYKDECPYKSCQTLEELKALDESYQFYYNNIRRMECHRKMTPVEYEAWFAALSSDEYHNYLAEKRHLYELMKNKNQQDAILENRMEKRKREQLYEK